MSESQITKHNNADAHDGPAKQIGETGDRSSFDAYRLSTEKIGLPGGKFSDSLPKLEILPDSQTRPSQSELNKSHSSPSEELKTDSDSVSRNKSSVKQDSNGR